METITVYEKSLFPFTDGYYYQFVQDRALTKIPHRHGFYELVCVLQGEAVQRVDGESVRITEGGVCILSPENAHCFESQSERLFVFSLSVDEPTFQRIQNAIGFTPVFGEVFELDANALRNNIKKLPLVAEAMKTVWLNAWLANIFVLLVHSGFPQRTGVPFALQRAVAKLRDPENLARGIPAFLELTGYSRVHLCRLTEKYYGKTPFRILREARMQLAEEYLKSTRLSVEEIAYTVGFASVSRFHAVFKAQHRLTPAQYRRKYTGNPFSV